MPTIRTGRPNAAAATLERTEMGQSTATARTQKRLPPLKQHFTELELIKPRKSMASRQESREKVNGNEERTKEVPFTRRPTKTRLQRSKTATKELKTAPFVKKLPTKPSDSVSTDLPDNTAAVKVKYKRRGTKPKLLTKTDGDSEWQKSVLGARWTSIAKRISLQKSVTNRMKNRFTKRREPSEKGSATTTFSNENTWAQRDSKISQPNRPAERPVVRRSKKARNKNKEEKSKMGPKSADVKSECSDDGKKIESIQTADEKVTSRTTDDSQKENNQEVNGTQNSGKRPAKASTKKSKNTSKASGQKSNTSAKNAVRETTPLRQVNMADFAQFSVSRRLTGSKSVSPSGADHHIHKLRTKSVNRRSVASVSEDENEASDKDKDDDTDACRPDIHVIDTTPHVIQQVIIEQPLLSPPSQPLLPLRRTESISTISDSTHLMPVAYPRQSNGFTLLSRGDSVDSRISHATTPESLPRIFGSPPPVHQSSSDTDSYNTGEISIVVPRLPQLNVAAPDDGERHRDIRSMAGEAEIGQHVDDEPIVIVTDEDGSHVKERDGRESGYSSMTPRLSVDSMAHTLSPMSCLMAGSAHLSIPSDHRSLTPYSTSSSYLDVPHSRPQSSIFDTASLTLPVDTAVVDSRKIFLEPRLTLQKLPAIESRCSNHELEVSRQSASPHRLTSPHRSASPHRLASPHRPASPHGQADLSIDTKPTSFRY